METIRDRTTLGALAGIASILTRDIYSYLAKQIGFSKFYVWNIAADLFVHGKAVQTPVGTILGILADMGTGALLGVLFVHFLRWTGGKNPLIKGVGLGVGAWLLLFGIMFHTLPQDSRRGPKRRAVQPERPGGSCAFWFCSWLLRKQAPSAFGFGFCP